MPDNQTGRIIEYTARKAAFEGVKKMAEKQKTKPPDPV